MSSRSGDGAQSLNSTKGMTVEMKKRKKDEGSLSDEYGTPVWLYSLLDKEFNFKLDVCASVQNAKCETFYDKDRNAFLQSWGLDALASDMFCNPPYSDILPWAVMMKKEIEDASGDLVGVMLNKLDPSTAHGRLCLKDADEVWIPEHRIAFEMPGATLTVANFPVCIPIFRKRRSKKSLAKIILVNYRDIMPVRRNKHST